MAGHVGAGHVRPNVTQKGGRGVGGDRGQFTLAILPIMNCRCAWYNESRLLLFWVSSIFCISICTVAYLASSLYCHGTRKLETPKLKYCFFRGSFSQPTLGNLTRNSWLYLAFSWWQWSSYHAIIIWCSRSGSVGCPFLTIYFTSVVLYKKTS